MGIIDDDKVRLELLQNVWDVVLCEGLQQGPLLFDLVRLTNDILINDSAVAFFEDDPLPELLSEHFDPDHPVWDYVSYVD